MAKHIPSSHYLEAVRMIQPRQSASSRGYDRTWQRVRLLHLQRNPLCSGKDCVALATEVDHIDRDVTNCDPMNLKSYCKSCHAKKTAEYDGSFGNGKKDE